MTFKLYRDYNEYFASIGQYFNILDRGVTSFERIESDFTDSFSKNISGDYFAKYSRYLNGEEGRRLLIEPVKLLFDYVVESAFNKDDNWQEHFESNVGESDRTAKAIALLKLNVFFCYLSAYNGNDTYLKDLISRGAFNSHLFYHLYLYEFLSQTPRPFWTRLPNQGENYVSLLYGEDNMKRILDKSRREKFSAFHDDLIRLCSSPHYLPVHEQLFSQFMTDENMRVGTNYTKSEFRNHFISAVCIEGDTGVFSRIFDAIGWFEKGHN